MATLEPTIEPKYERRFLVKSGLSVAFEETGSPSHENDTEAPRQINTLRSAKQNTIHRGGRLTAGLQAEWSFLCSPANSSSNTAFQASL
jgi:hypothetical protein